ncbi:unnamed protein product [Schistosoma rodhaini]|nr:unnamed protein product [Schistosoma rodhaini]
MRLILEDATKFYKPKGERDKTLQIEKQLTDIVKNLKNKGIITQDLYDHIRPMGSIIPRLYGLPKVHKAGLPLRPILDMSSSPYHRLAQWLAEKLEPVRRQVSKYSIHDTFQFIDRIKDVNTSGKHMFSLDVNSLFTSLPLTETICYICEYIDSNNIDLGIPTELLKELLLRCTFNVQFSFNNEIYRQRDGIAMGSPLGPILADCFMAKLENNQLSSMINRFQLYVRYIDDTFVVCDDNIDLDDILHSFNSCHPSIDFTLEREKDQSIPFLDVHLLRRSNGSLKRSIFRKQTWNGQLTNFYSWVPLNRKRNLIHSLCYRIHRICSTECINEELEFLKKTLMKNGYPDRFIEKNMNRSSVDKNLSYSVPKKSLYISLEFKGDRTSDIIKNRLTTTIKRTFNAAKLRITFTSKNLFSVSIKDKLPRLVASMCIYQFTCSCGARYIGRSQRSLSTRIREHIPVWFYNGERKAVRSSILEHLIDCNHSTNPQSDFKVVYIIRSNLPRFLRIKLLKIAEALTIHELKPELCVQKKYVLSLSLPWP